MLLRSSGLLFNRTILRGAGQNASLHRGFATSTTPSGMRRRSVVGSFLFRRHDDGTPRVALFRRSAEVNTYQHKYAAVSGGIEAEDATPLDAALREIKEETQLTSQSVRYLCSGPTWSFYDKKLNYQWTVYPFAFYWPASAEAREPLVLGWEHEGYHWFKPQELKEEDLSGGILDSLRRVWPTGGLVGIDVLGRYCLGDGVDNGVDPRRDTETALAVFRGTVAGIDTEDPEWWTNVRLAAWHIWNYSDERIRGPLLARLVADLQKLEGLQRDAGLKERAAKALGQVDLGDSQAQLDAHQVFADLWESK